MNHIWLLITKKKIKIIIILHCPSSKSNSFGKGGQQSLTDLKPNMKWKGADKASIRQTGSVFYRESGLGVMCPTQLLFPCAVGDYSRDGF